MSPISEAVAKAWIENLSKALPKSSSWFEKINDTSVRFCIMEFKGGGGAFNTFETWQELASFAAGLAYRK